jgi:hypothetical protein
MSVDCDRLLLKALQLAQFSVQYILGSNKLLESKQKTIQKALKTFQEEEEVLDIKLSKLR